MLFCFYFIATEAVADTEWEVTVFVVVAVGLFDAVGIGVVVWLFCPEYIIECRWALELAIKEYGLQTNIQKLGWSTFGNDVLFRRAVHIRQFSNKGLCSIEKESVLCEYLIAKAFEIGHVEVQILFEWAFHGVYCKGRDGVPPRCRVVQKCFVESYYETIPKIGWLVHLHLICYIYGRNTSKSICDDNSI